ncbi:PAAR domain-containing protein [Marivita sp. S0852]|uniref:PAAR domain-containing protein n=1 Tax=Marivita sp. S0852 TaxID=3373893 RepID=UPI0039821E51
MAGLPQARVFDLHGCMLPTIPPPPPPGVPAPIPIAPPCCVTVLVKYLPAARLGDMTMAAPPHPIIKGSATVLIGKMPAARIGDTCMCGGPILKGEPTVLVGG